MKGPRQEITGIVTATTNQNKNFIVVGWDRKVRLHTSSYIKRAAESAARTALAAAATYPGLTLSLPSPPGVRVASLWFSTGQIDEELCPCSWHVCVNPRCNGKPQERCKHAHLIRLHLLWVLITITKQVRR